MAMLAEATPLWLDAFGSDSCIGVKATQKLWLSEDSAHARYKSYGVQSSPHLMLSKASTATFAGYLNLYCLLV